MRLADLRAIVLYSLILLFGQFGCGGGLLDADAATAPLVTSLSPKAMAAGQSGFTLNVYGANFSDRSSIEWNGARQATTFVSSREVKARISSQAVAQASTVSVTVKNLKTGQSSNPMSFIVGGPIQITTTQLPAGQTGVSYSAPVSFSGGVSPLHWSLAAGNLPTGLAVDSATGQISGTPASIGQSSFTVRVTDALNSTAKAALSIAVVSSPGGTGGSATSQFYGSGLDSDGLANTTLGPNGNTVSYRFRAKNSGMLEQALVYLIPDHKGYAAGTGGTIQVTLNTDDGSSSHNPSSTVLASYVMSNVLSLPSPARYFYVMKFDSTPTLTAGQLYHLVFTNVDANPTVNYLSVDALYQASPGTPAQPTVSDTDAAVLLGMPWAPRKGFTPIYQLSFADGTTEGIGYIEGWVGAPEPISGSNAVRETFTVSGSPVKVTSASIRLARVNGNDALTVRLENANGTLIEQGSIPGSEIPVSSSSSPSDNWATYPFSTTYTLEPGNTYNLVFEAASTSTYEAYPIRKGGAYGFSTSTYFPDGYAEFNQSGSWVGWTQWGVTNRTDGDLQFYFAVAP